MIWDKYSFCCLGLLMLLALFFNSSALAGNPIIIIEEQTVDIGELNEGDIGQGKITIKNGGDAPLELTNIVASCGCTIVDFEPRSVEPNSAIQLNFTVDTKGKMGEILKGIQILSNDPKTPKLFVYASARVLTPMHAQANTGALFKGECGNCHTVPAQGKTGEALFEAACFMCHGHYGLGGVAKPINVFEYVNAHDADYYRKIITDGKPDTSMPAFSRAKGGPLNDEQIESLVELMLWWREGFIFKANPAVPRTHR